MIFVHGAKVLVAPDVCQLFFVDIAKVMHGESECARRDLSIHADSDSPRKGLAYAGALCLRFFALERGAREMSSSTAVVV